MKNELCRVRIATHFLKCNTNQGSKSRPIRIRLEGGRTESDIGYDTINDSVENRKNSAEISS